MKANFKKLMCLALASGMVFSTAACGGGGAGTSEDLNTEDAKTIYIEAYEGGYGTVWLEAVADMFEIAYASEGYEVKINPNPALLQTSIEAGLKAGPKITITDLYLGGDINVRAILDQGRTYIPGGQYEMPLADLTDVYNNPVYGETTLYKNKLNAQLVSKNEYNGKYYSTNWSGGSTGFAYNAEIFAENGWTVPKTTNEMIDLIAKAKSNYTCFAWHGEASYWSYAMMPWWKQLASEEEVERFWKCEDEDGNLTADVFNTQARLAAYELVEDMIYDKANVYAKSETLTRIEAQMLLYNKKNKVLMMPTGDWCENEMDINGYPRESSNIGFMKTPVASDAIYQYDKFGQKQFRFETVRDDATLSAVVAAIDNLQTSYEGVSAADFAAIKKLRSYTVSVSYLHNALIPAFANAKVGAKKFLAFLASDQALQKYYDLTGCFLPYDNSNVQLKSNPTRFQSELYKASLNATFTYEKDSNAKIWYKTALYWYHDSPEGRIGSIEDDVKLTALELFTQTYRYYESNFETYMALAGII